MFNRLGLELGQSTSSPSLINQIDIAIAFGSRINSVTTFFTQNLINLSLARCAVTLAAHVFFDKIGKIHENTQKIRKKILRYVTYLLWSSLNILCLIQDGGNRKQTWSQTVSLSLLLRDPTFSRFDTIPECDRQTDTQTRRRHVPGLPQLQCGKNILKLEQHVCRHCVQYDIYVYHILAGSHDEPQDLVSGQRKVNKTINVVRQLLHELTNIPLWIKNRKH